MQLIGLVYNMDSYIYVTGERGGEEGEGARAGGGGAGVV